MKGFSEICGISEMDLQIYKVFDWSILFSEDHLQMRKKSPKFVSLPPIILMNCRFISEKNLRLMPVVLQEGNRKSPRTAAHICKSISEIPGNSEMFWY